jgi:hypothetical protein
MEKLNILLVREEAARGKQRQLSTLLHTASVHGPTAARKRPSVRAGEKLDRKKCIHHETLFFQGLNSTVVSIKCVCAKVVHGDNCLKLNAASYAFLKLLHLQFSKAYLKLEC